MRLKNMLLLPSPGPARSATCLSKCFSALFYLSPSLQLLENYDSALPSLIAVSPEPTAVASTIFSLVLVKDLHIE
jgi:hypothetical protein